eukprot:679571-Amphidinium_carterae.1
MPQVLKKHALLRAGACLLSQALMARGPKTSLALLSSCLRALGQIGAWTELGLVSGSLDSLLRTMVPHQLARHGRFMAEGKLTFAYGARRAQMCELKHRHRCMPPAASGDDPFGLFGDVYLFMHVSETRGLLTVSPALEKFVSAELRKEFKGEEARCKALEERGPPEPCSRVQPEIRLDFRQNSALFKVLAVSPTLEKFVSAELREVFKGEEAQEERGPQEPCSRIQQIRLINIQP